MRGALRNWEDGPCVESPSRPMRAIRARLSRSDRAAIRRRAMVALLKAGFARWEIEAALHIGKRAVNKQLRKIESLRREVLRHAG